MTVKIDNYNIYFEAYGQGEKVFLLHGWGGNSQTFQPLIPYLENMGYQVIAIDLPGFGKTGKLHSPMSTRDYVETIREMLHELGSENPNLIGHSFGGRIALSYSINYPTKKLVLIDSAGIKRRSLKIKLFIFFSKILKPLKPMLNNAASRFSAKDIRNVKDNNLRATFKLSVEEDLTPLLHKVATPTLIIWGEEDEETPIRDAAIFNNNIKQSLLSVISGAGHFPFLEYPKVVADLIIEFLKKEGASLTH